MRDRPQILKAVALLLKRIIRRRRSFNPHFIRLDLKRLLCLRCSHQCTGHDDRCSHIQLGDFRKILHLIMINNLKRLEIRAVIYHDKSERLRITETADPSADRDLFIKVFVPVLK